MGLRIGIDVGGTFTHGVVLEPPGSVIATARTPTTHTAELGVAAGVEEVLRKLLAELDRLGRGTAEVELVAHSTTQATNALLEGDLSGVHLMAIAPPGERGMVSRALKQRFLDIGGGHRIQLWPKLMEDWVRATAEHYPDQVAPLMSAKELEPQTRVSEPAGLASIPVSDKPGFDAYGVPRGFWVSEQLPVAVVQPLAGKLENREHCVAGHYRGCGHPTVAASEITQVLGLAARARTAVVNAAMLPTMLKTADYTEAAVARMLPGVPLQVVRSDGGAMTIGEMRRQPILSLLSGPAAGASAALHRSGLSDAVFIEVGGTSTDITLIKDGRVRHRYATVGGQRLMVPALDLRTVAVGGGSMLRADKPLFGPRSAHIAGLPYLFQALSQGFTIEAVETWLEPGRAEEYIVAKTSSGSLAAVTITDVYLLLNGRVACEQLGMDEASFDRDELRRVIRLAGGLNNWQPDKRRLAASDYFVNAIRQEAGQPTLDEHGTRRATEERIPLLRITHAFGETCDFVADAIRELAKSSEVDLARCRLVSGGGGGPTIQTTVASHAGLLGDVKTGQPTWPLLIPDHAVISAIGAALAVTCVSLSRHAAQPTSGDIAELIDEVESRLAAQGAERVQTDYEYDPRRQVLTVTGRGSRPYEQDATVHTMDQLRDIAKDVLKADPDLRWMDDGTWLWGSVIHKTSRRGTTQLACATDRFGRILWLGDLAAMETAAAGRVHDALDTVVARHTQHTDGGAVLPHLGLLTGGRYIPLDQLGSAELIAEVLRWERLPADAEGCFVVGK